MTAETTDAYGIEHAPKCDQPGLTIKPSTMPGWNLARCTNCKGQRLTRRDVTA